MPERVRRRDVSRAERRLLSLAATVARRQRRAYHGRDRRSGALYRNLWKRRKFLRDEQGRLYLRMTTPGIQSAYATKSARVHGYPPAQLPRVEGRLRAAFDDYANLLIRLDIEEQTAYDRLRARGLIEPISEFGF